MAGFLSIFKSCGPLFHLSLYWFSHFVLRFGGMALIARLLLEMAVLRLGPNIYTIRPLLLNHISKIPTGPSADYAAETQQSGERGRERSGITVLFIPPLGPSLRSCYCSVGGWLTGMIDRGMRDGEETFQPITAWLSLSSGEVVD